MFIIRLQPKECSVPLELLSNYELFANYKGDGNRIPNQAKNGDNLFTKYKKAGFMKGQSLYTSKINLQGDTEGR